MQENQGPAAITKVMTVLEAVSGLMARVTAPDKPVASDAVVSKQSNDQPGEEDEEDERVEEGDDGDDGDVDEEEEAEEEAEEEMLPGEPACRTAMPRSTPAEASSVPPAPAAAATAAVTASGGTDEAGDEAQSASPATMKRHKAHVASACSNCKRAHLACDEARPCRRCIAIKRESSCMDIPHKRRGRPRLRLHEAHDTELAPGQPVNSQISPIQFHQHRYHEDARYRCGQEFSQSLGAGSRRRPLYYPPLATHSRSFSSGAMEKSSQFLNDKDSSPLSMIHQHHYHPHLMHDTNLYPSQGSSGPQEMMHPPRHTSRDYRAANDGSSPYLVPSPAPTGPPNFSRNNSSGMLDADELVSSAKYFALMRPALSAPGLYNHNDRLGPDGHFPASPSAMSSEAFSHDSSKTPSPVMSELHYGHLRSSSHGSAASNAIPGSTFTPNLFPTSASVQQPQQQYLRPNAGPVGNTYAQYPSFTEAVDHHIFQQHVKPNSPYQQTQWSYEGGGSATKTFNLQVPPAIVRHATKESNGLSDGIHGSVRNSDSLAKPDMSPLQKKFSSVIEDELSARLVTKTTLTDNQATVMLINPSAKDTSPARRLKIGMRDILG